VQALKLGYRCGFDDFALLKEIGGVYARQGKYSAAIPVLQRAIAVTRADEDGGPMEVHALLGDCLSEVGELEASKQQWVLVQLAAAPNSEPASLAAVALHAIDKSLGRA